MQLDNELIVNGNVNAKALHLILTKGYGFSSWIKTRIKRHRMKEGIHYFKEEDDTHILPGRKPIKYFLNITVAQKIAKEYNFQLPLPQYNERQEEYKQEYVQPEPEKAVKKIRTIEINLEDTDEEVCIILNGIKMLLNFGK